MQKARRIAILAAWFASVCWYWRENVPLVPTRVIEVPVNRVMASPTPAGEIPLIPIEANSFISRQHGPVEFWSIPEARIVRELFSADDQIVSGPAYPNREYLIRRRDHLEIHSEQGERLGTLPDIARVDHFQVLPNRLGVLIRGSTGLERYTLDGEPVWSRNDVRADSAARGQFVVVRWLRPRPGEKKSGMALLHVESGQIVPEFDNPGRYRSISLSPDGQFAAVATYPNDWAIYQLSSGEALWQLPAESRIDYFEFRTLGDDLVAIGTDMDDAVTRTRWTALDGRKLPALTESESRVLSQQTTGRGSIALEFAASNPPIWLQRLFQSAWIPAFLQGKLRLSIFRYRFMAIDNYSECLIGHFPDDVIPTILTENQGVLVSQPGRLLHYGLPLRRNWSWLIGWLFIPPTGLMLGRAGWRQFRGSRSPSAA